jgi:hypothetical protein
MRSQSGGRIARREGASESIIQGSFPTVDFLGLGGAIDVA